MPHRGVCSPLPASLSVMVTVVKTSPSTLNRESSGPTLVIVSLRGGRETEGRGESYGTIKFSVT